MAGLTPMMQQYMAVKEQCPDCILFFRLGDFYEMFNDDARLASEELDLVLTTRDRGKDADEQTPMCGVPYHSCEAYIARLIQKGYKVAICEQTQDPATAKGLVDRDIVRIITPGTAIDSGMLPDSKNNYISSAYADSCGAAMCFADISTGEMQLLYIDGSDWSSQLQNELFGVAPVECVLGGEAARSEELIAFLKTRLTCRCETALNRLFEPLTAREQLEKHFGERAVWNILIAISVIISLVFSIGIFVIGPTAVINWMTAFTENEIVLNLTEGLLRIAIFVIYVLLISKMKDIHRVFQYHGAEHKCIHCFESGRELTPENCQEFYTLHPRCGTSFLVFVLVISLIVFSFLGWPNLALRIVSRLLLIPFIAGISYEVLKWAGKSDNWFIKIISIPGLYLQKLTTAPPDNEQLEVAIAAVKAVMDEDAPLYEGIAGKDGKFIKTAEEFYEEAGV